MKKRVFIIHGWEGSPAEPMHQWLKNELEEKGFEVTVPAMPDPETPRIPDWLEKIGKVVGEPDENTYFIGHSIGSSAALRYVASLDAKIGGILSIAGWFGLRNIEPEEETVARPWIDTPIDFEKVKTNSKQIVAILSDNDPFVPLEKTKKIFEERLGAQVIVEHNMGHFDPDSGIEAVLSARDAILEMTK